MFIAISSLYAGVTSCKQLEIKSCFHFLKTLSPGLFLGLFAPKKSSKQEFCQNNFTQFSVFMLL